MEAGFKKINLMFQPRLQLDGWGYLTSALK